MHAHTPNMMMNRLTIACCDDFVRCSMEIKRKWPMMIELCNLRFKGVVLGPGCNGKRSLINFDSERRKSSGCMQQRRKFTTHIATNKRSKSFDLLQLKYALFLSLATRQFLSCPKMWKPLDIDKMATKSAKMEQLICFICRQFWF